MTREQILDELKNILAPYTKEKEKLQSIHEKTDLINDLQINSANLVDIIIDAEEQYDIEIDMDDAEKMTNVANTISIIQEKVEAK